MQVELRDLSHHFPSGVQLFSDVNLRLIPGETYALVGPSGSGKSTLLAMLSKWMQPATGQIIWEGIDRQSWVFQNPYGVARRTALDHVLQPFLARGFSWVEGERRAADLLTRFGLGTAENKLFRDLSGGEAQRLMLARGMATDPQLFLVDEPTAQLDMTTAQTVNAAIQHLATEQAIVVVATHDPETRDSCTKTIDLGDYR